MNPVPLSAATRARMDLLFSVEDRRAAALLLEEECANNLPYLERAGPKELERYRLAALKLSNGSLVKLARAVEMAKIDWRDLLMAAGFGEEAQAHERWWPGNNNR